VAAEHLGKMAETPLPLGLLSWARLYEQAGVALQRNLATRGELTPRSAAEVVAAALPAPLRRWLLSRLTRLGWLDADARIPFDILERPQCPPDLCGRPRELVRLALFGVGGQGIPADAKHREAVFQQVCGDVMRETRDLQSLQQAGARALSHPDVQRDSILAGMVRGFLLEREMDFKSRQQERHPAERVGSHLRRAFGDRVEDRGPTKAQVQSAFQKLRMEFEEQSAQFEEAASRAALVRMRGMLKRYPEQIDKSALEECEQKHAKLVARCDVYRQQIEELTQQAVDAARRGDQKTASWTLRRMSAVHEMRPMLLPADRFAVLREQIIRAGAEHDHDEALRALASRERAVAAEIKKLGEVVDRYHKAARQLPHDDARYLRIRAQYERAVAEIRSHDTEWLAELMIELDALLDDLEDASGQAETQVDRFITSVRTALHGLRGEIQTIQREQADAEPRP
jgi:hypothetical protein